VIEGKPVAQTALLIVIVATSPCVLRAEVSLPRDTVVIVKLLEFVSSETSLLGDRVRFAVAKEVAVDGAVVIRRGAPATGKIVDASPYRLPGVWSSSRRGRLAFTVDETSAVDGQIVRLSMSTPARRTFAASRSSLIQWVHEPVQFETRIDGDYRVNSTLRRVADACCVSDGLQPTITSPSQT
jgi:hypothetical protein